MRKIGTAVTQTDHPEQPATEGHAVLLAWTDGSHTLECFSAAEAQAERQAFRLVRQWRGGPIRLAGYAVVKISPALWLTHRESGTPCREPGCPLR